VAHAYKNDKILVSKYLGKRLVGRTKDRIVGYDGSVVVDVAFTSE
jgi:hypothetical protein